MKICFISDTHEKHDRISIPECDALVHSGDFTLMGELEQVKRFNKWMGQQPCDHSIVIAGNHEVYFANQLTLDDRKELLSKSVYLENEGTSYKGYHFWGSPITPLYGYGWALMLPRNSEELKSHWENIPDGLDVLITHGPPFGYLDQSTSYSDHVGDELLSKKLDSILPEYSPSIHVFGHIHGGRGFYKDKNTLLINASSVNEAYKYANEPIVVEI